VMRTGKKPKSNNRGDREKGLEAKIEYGEAAFYGPKLDFMVKDAIGRNGNWVLSRLIIICPKGLSLNIPGGQ
jgi:hypothetical protein